MPTIDPTTPAGVQPTIPGASGYVLTASDEFNSSTLDSKWTAGKDTSNRTVPTNFDINAGGNSCLRTWPVSPYSDNETEFISDGANSFRQRYGVFEVRVKHLRGKGLFTAPLWLFEEASQQEIDVVECFGYGPNAEGYNDWVIDNVDWRLKNSVFTVWKDGGGPPTERTGAVFTSSYGYDTTISTAFHIFTCKWSVADGFQWYHNNVARGNPIPDPWGAGSTVPLYLYMGQMWWGPRAGLPVPNTTETPTGQSNSIEIDYIRVWQPGDSSNPVLPPGEPPQNGATYYVSPTGNDANVGSLTSPFLTFTKAISVTNPGDTVIFENGTYVSGQVNINRSGTATDRIVYRARNKFGAIISQTDGNNPGISVRASNITILDFRMVLHSSYVKTIEYTSASCHIRAWNGSSPTPGNPTTGWIGTRLIGLKTEDARQRDLAIKINHDYSIVRGCEMDNMLEMLNVRNTDFYNNLITAQDRFSSSILCKGGVRDCRVYNNVVHNYMQYGQAITLGGYSCDSCHFDTATNIEAYNSVMFNNVVINHDTGATGCHGLVMQGAQNCAAYNNVTIGCKYGAFLGGHNTGPQANNTGILWRNNIAVARSGDALTTSSYFVSGGSHTFSHNNWTGFTSTPSQSNAISGDPLLVNNQTDWHLQAGSPCRNTALVLSPLPAYHGGTLDVSLDKDFVPRGTQWSLGLYEVDTAEPGATFNAAVTVAPVNGATISGIVPFAISGDLIQNAELLPPTGYVPSYGTFVLTGDTSGAFNWNTAALPNGSISVRIAAFDQPAGQPANEITAMATRTYTINNVTDSTMPICTAFDIA